jgi:hypothetical protein
MAQVSWMNISFQSTHRRPPAGSAGTCINPASNQKRRTTHQAPSRKHLGSLMSLSPLCGGPAKKQNILDISIIFISQRLAAFSCLSIKKQDIYSFGSALVLFWFNPSLNPVIAKNKNGELRR